MAGIDLQPQVFEPDAETLVPAIDLFEQAKATLPQVYLNAPNFMGALQAIMKQKQYLYDVIRSLVNVYNLNSSDAFTIATPTGIYLRMLGSNTTTQFTESDDDPTILNFIQNRINFINSRGRFLDFYRYFALNGFASSFTPSGFQEVGNATININVPLSGSGTPDPLTQFTYDMFRLKSAGVEININPSVPYFFGFSNLAYPESKNPTAKGFGFVDSRGVVTGGGFFSTELPP